MDLLLIVRDMFLTGIDAPSLHTMYLDKPIKGHTLVLLTCWHFRHTSRASPSRRVNSIINHILK
jgi:hypothetical protein